MIKDDATTFNPEIASALYAESASIDLYYRGYVKSISAQSLPFVIGRDGSSCALAVLSEMASRVHCTLVIKDGQVGLLDHSTNGTMVKIGQGDSVLIKDRFYPLSGQGCIKLGAGIRLDDPDLVLFRLAK